MNSLHTEGDEHSKLSAAERRQLIYELQEELETWAKGKIWLFLLVLSLIGFFGVRSLVREMVNSEMREAIRAAEVAKIAASDAVDATKKAQTTTTQYMEIVQKLQENAANLQVEMASQQTRLNAEKADFEKASNLSLGELNLKVSQLDKRAGLVDNLLRKIENGQTLANAVTDYEDYSNKSGIEIEQIKAKFWDNSKFKVTIRTQGDLPSREVAQRLATIIAACGFMVSTSITSARFVDPSYMSPNISYNPDNWFWIHEEFRGIHLQAGPVFTNKKDELIHIVRTWLTAEHNQSPFTDKQGWDAHYPGDYPMMHIPPNEGQIFIRLPPPPTPSQPPSSPVGK